MKKPILYIATILLTIFLCITVLRPLMAETEGEFYYMTVTAYSLHLIADKHNDGLTASNTPIREGVVAINVDYIDGRWLIKSPLNLGDEIYIEGMGNYSVEDTGYFTDTDYKQDFWNVDVYMEDYEEAVIFGRQLRRVFILSD